MNNWAPVKSVSWAFWYFIGRWICCWRFFFRVWSPASVLLITGLHQDWFVIHTVNSLLKGKLKYTHLYSLVQSCQQSVIGWWLTLNMPMFGEILSAVRHDGQTNLIPKTVILYLKICFVIWIYKKRNNLTSCIRPTFYLDCLTKTVTLVGHMSAPKTKLFADLLA